MLRMQQVVERRLLGANRIAGLASMANCVLYLAVVLLAARCEGAGPFAESRSNPATWHASQRAAGQHLAKSCSC